MGGAYSQIISYWFKLFDQQKILALRFSLIYSSQSSDDESHTE